MLFTLTDVLVSFQSYINKILTEKLEVFGIIYKNNMIVYTNIKDHIYFL